MAQALNAHADTAFGNVQSVASARPDYQAYQLLHVASSISRCAISDFRWALSLWLA